MITIYTKSESGELTRSRVAMSKADHVDYYNVPPTSSTERVVGWTEQYIEWHGRIGYGCNEVQS